ncbi:MAG: virulence factor SrfB [Pseudomonadota bacterium]
MLTDTNATLKKITKLRDEITLVPFSGIQMLDFGFNIDEVSQRPSQFIERITDEQDGQPILTLYPLTGDEDRDADVLDARREDDDDYSIRPNAALEPFLEKWVPIPFLRLKTHRGPAGEPQYDAGPSSWARMRVVELAKRDEKTGHSHRLQMAFDTNLIERADDDLFYAPDLTDAEKSRDFEFVSEPNDNAWFLQRLTEGEDGEIMDLQRWVSDWLKDMFIEFKRAERPGRRFSEDDLPHSFEHWARYLTYLKLVKAAVTPPSVRFVNTVSKRDAVKPVNVDLVLDVGNSRTCGILIEQFPGESRVDLARSFELEIRDLGKPEHHYAGLFPSRVEFSDVKFGDERYASRSGRRNAFLWPSFVRIGPEAVRLVQGEEGTETVSGLSSPKRYLWDDAIVQQDWRFHNHDDPNNLPKTVRSAMRHLNEAGDVMDQVKHEVEQKLRKRGSTPTSPAIRPRFSRSSMYGFMMAEVLSHALIQINDPASRSKREQANLPRRLNRVILSLPTATPVKEQAIIRSRVQGAMRLIWKQMGLDKCEPPYSERPKVVVDWDEASCTQLVYLYSEITQKFDGRIDDFLKMKGRTRKGPSGTDETSLRLASVDIGGGTTDLMITTYRGEANRVLHPEQTFREGFRVAGDDLVERVIAVIIIPQLQQAIEQSGGQYVAEKMRELFGGDIGGQEQQIVQQRKQFSLRVLMPLAEALLAKCETSDEFERLDIDVAEILGLTKRFVPDGDGSEDTASENDFVEEEPEEEIRDEVLLYLERAAEGLGAKDWRLSDVVLTISRMEVDAVSREVFQRVLSNMAEVMDFTGVDVVLLTGRPSRLPAVRSILQEMLIVPPHRLISMHRYKTGTWYPFRDARTQRIGDPKSTVAVGGMLITLAENRIQNFKVMIEAFQMRSTIKYVGEMERNGQIPNNNILFSNIDMDARGSDTAELMIHSPITIGTRQLPLERWTTTQLFKIDIAEATARGRRTPIKVTLRKSDFDDNEGDSSEDTLRRESMREAFEIDTVYDGADDAMKPNEISFQFQTLGEQDEYWIDTGVFKV